MIIRLLPILSLFSLTLWLAAASRPITLVKDGKPNSCIVVGEHPTKSASLAAAELRHVVELITGARLPVVARKEKGMPRIFVGMSPEAAELGFPGKPFTGEEYLVGRKDDDLFLMGHDEPDYGKFDYSDFKTFPALIYYYRSTTYGVYDFLEKSCGVRFCNFGDLGIVRPQTKTLSVVPREIRRKPAMDAFRRPYFGSRAKEYKISDRDALLLQVRWRSNAMFAVTNHSVYSIYYRYWNRAKPPSQAKLFMERRPEYFARNTNTNLKSAIWRHFSANPVPPPQLCTSHPGPVEYFAECAAQIYEGKTIEGHPGAETRRKEDQPFYYPVQEDDNGVWCQCKDCKEKNYRGEHFDWVNRVARKAAGKNPAIEISTLAYSSSTAYPPNIKLKKNIAVQMCYSIQSWYHPRVYAKQHGEYKEWVKNEGKKRPLLLWLYMLCPAGEAKKIYNYQKFFPIVYPWKAGAYIKEFARDGIRGWFGEIEPGQHMLEAYILAKISDDPTLDPNLLIDEYFKLYYGHAGPAMKEFYKTLEQIVWDIRNYSDSVRSAAPQWSYVYGLHRERDNWYLGTAERVARLDGIVRKAEKAAVLPVEKQRIRFFRDTLWDQAVQGRKEYEERERIRKILIPSATPDYSGECGGDISGVDFSMASRLSPFVTLENRKADKSPSLSLASDSTHLYFRFQEEGDETFRHLKEDFWMNCLEIFLGSKRESDYLQMAYSPTGKVRAYTSLIVEGVRKISEIPVDFKTENTCDANGWTLTGAIPLSLIPSGIKAGGWKNSQFFGNFFRTKRYNKGESLVWSPVFTTDYKSGFYRMGSIFLPGPSFSGVIFQKPLVLSSGRNAPGGWMRGKQKNMDRKTPVTLRNGVFAIDGSQKQQIHFYYTNGQKGEKEYVQANRGDKLIFEFKAKGRSRMEVGAYFSHARGGGANLRTKPVWLANEEKDFQVTVEVVNKVKIRPVTSLRPLLVFPKGTTAEIRDLKITLIPRGKSAVSSKH